MAVLIKPLLGYGGTSAALIMFISEMKKARSVIRLVGGIIVLAATLGAVKLWTSAATGGWVSTGAMIGAGLGVFVVAWMVGIWLRNRQRRRFMDRRDSALW